MKNMVYVCIVFLLAAFAGRLASQTDIEALFQEGNSLYQQGYYREALSSYEKITESGYHNAALYYNMGNCFYKLDDIGRAVLYYEKAAKLDPGDEAVQANLALANLAVVDRIEPMEKHLIVRMVEGFFELIPRPQLTMFLAGAYLLTMALVILRLISRSYRVQFMSLRAALLCGFFLLIFALAWMGQRQRQKNSREAVVLSKEVRVMSAPAEEDAMELFTLHEGTKVHIDKSTGGWIEIVLADGKVGWMKTEDVGMI